MKAEIIKEATFVNAIKLLDIDDNDNNIKSIKLNNT